MAENYNASNDETTADIQNNSEYVNTNNEKSPKTDDSVYSESSKNSNRAVQNNAWRESPPLPPNNEIRYNNQYRPIIPQSNNQYYPPFYQPFMPKKSSVNPGFAIASLVLGISAVITIFFKNSICLVCAILALIFGIISLAKNNSGKGMSIAGIILGSAVLIFFYVIFLIVAYALFTFEI